ncbi:PREDICTED: neuronal pentraxin-2-like [Cyprinodon variegatus]|uniref:neuronal pentraxin-2-like n=1 Tax=Cyprinodon variegatus TaxID=28743 RepID=UPI000742C430|nr:PREDICTED: neuronal pentraxin-2-like [Cyprinodon variegatus]
MTATTLITMMTHTMKSTAAATMMTIALVIMVAITMIIMKTTMAHLTMKTIKPATMVAIGTTIKAIIIIDIMNPTTTGTMVVTIAIMKSITAATTMTIIRTTVMTIMEWVIMMTTMMATTLRLRTMSPMKGSILRDAFLTLVRKQACGALDTARIHKKLKSPNAFLLEFPMRTNYMYARMKRSVVNEIFALTICLWLKPGEGPGLGTPISYAVPGQANELVLMEWGSNPMELLINDKAVTLPITLKDGKWHHVCVTWSTRDGVWEAFQDGVKKGSGQNLSAWHSIKPGGTFILGQEQDTMGDRFDITQSFLGELSDLQFWSRVLTASEIHTQATCGGHLVGDVMSWSEELVELHGGLTELPFEPCS